MGVHPRNKFLVPYIVFKAGLNNMNEGHAYVMSK